MIEYSKLKLSLKTLELQWENLEELRNTGTATPLIMDGIRESVIKWFDLALEMSWKMLAKYLGEEVGVPDLPTGPKPILRIADQNGLLDGRVAEWLEYVNARNASTHDYSAKKAEETLKVVPGFIADAIKLYTLMSGEAWE